MIPLIISIVGLVIYAFGERIHPKATEVGRILLWTGLLAWMLTGMVTRL